MLKAIIHNGKHTVIPHGYTVRDKGKVLASDLTFDSVNKSWVKVTRFMIDTDVNMWLLIIKEAIPSYVFKLIRASKHSDVNHKNLCG